jgi:tRNA(adenine34) deaminase
MSSSEHEIHMRRCVELARLALATGDTPVGSVVVRAGVVVGEGIEAVRAQNDVTAHAEIQALRAASALVGSADLAGCTLYTTVEPCVMCAYAVRLARIALVVSGTRPRRTDGDMDGHDVRTNPRILPTRVPPAVVRDMTVGPDP